MWHWFMLLTCHHENKHSINNNFINCNSTPYNRDTEHLKWAPLFAVGLEWMAFLNVFLFLCPSLFFLPSFPIFLCICHLWGVLHYASDNDLIMHASQYLGIIWVARLRFAASGHPCHFLAKNVDPCSNWLCRFIACKANRSKEWS